MKIIVVGSGYVGLSNAILLAQHNEVTIIDIDSRKVELLKNGESPIDDSGVKEYLQTKPLNLTAKLGQNGIYKDANYIVVATPTDYDPSTNYFNTKSIEKVVEQALTENQKATIVIKSTIPIGYTDELNKRFCTNRIVFSPEFLREGNALYDNLHPSRIIMGAKTQEAVKYAELVRRGSLSQDVPLLFLGAREAEAVKLFANTYLAMRVAYFNELDSFALQNGLEAKEIIDGVGLEPRIGAHYNNPSFGYGGYCFPKDTKQMLANFDGTPQRLISAIVESNDVRKMFLAESILKMKPSIVGVYRLIMKTGSDNYRSSAVLDVISFLEEKGIEIKIFEPTIKNWRGAASLENDLSEFKDSCDVIIANRLTEEIRDIQDKVYTRDVYGDN
ncbi:nucleotide sugar dehydrogenase [Kangiella geojedonensis]|uniref:UDP-glucose 6-dehydrogenase n=1 Tax=Kangiella geojedonensis TaxID=914150 RepID=A0A0F6RCV2_9GAMM|nr:nucleotide sugar dehydrogenase [Kangiella geojedonensis]AKE52346.1 Nucleotide sugar dehydrogenase [Kangiella geojedonensis]